jgi:hypothetical protein
MIRSNDSRVANILDEYLASLQAGQAPTKEELLARYPDLADDLAPCLETLQFIRGAALAPTMAAEPGASSTGDQAAATLGDFRLIRPIGHGGMGVVYEAEQISLGRRVALKVLPFAATMDPRQLQRFQNEARAVAQLHHTNIVPVHYVGCERGVHFYAMQYIDGHSLATGIAELRGRADDRPTKPQPAPAPQPGATVDVPPDRKIEPVPPSSTVRETTVIAGLTTVRSTKDAEYFVQSLSLASRRRRRSIMLTRWASFTGTSNRPTC